MKKQFGSVAAVVLCLASVSFSQTYQSQLKEPSATHSSSQQNSLPAPPAPGVASESFVDAAMRRKPWDRALFLGGGFGSGEQSSDHFLHAGIRLGKVLTGPAGPGVLKGQFEYAVELMPYWQAFTPKRTYAVASGNPPVASQAVIGGTYSGLSITPIILHWNLVRWKRIMPWVQGAGGLIWTDHKFPPNGVRGTSVWNFTPQFGIGIHYFLRPKQSITLGANAIHISNASLGDTNPGVNATAQFQIGYTWWK